MRVAIDEKDFIKYPFLKESQSFVGSYAGSPDRFLDSPLGKAALENATARIMSAIRSKAEAVPIVPGSTDSNGVRIAVAGYAIARIIVSCMKDRMIIDRLTRYESQRAYEYLADEDEEKKTYIAKSLGLDFGTRAIPLIPYIELVSGMREDRWRLVNRDVWGGLVQVRQHEIDELLRERIRVSIHRNLPVPVPSVVCELVSSQISMISAAEQSYLLEQFGTVDEGSFPPCMNALIVALSAGTNISHPGRFALTAFLHNIGMNPTEIINLFCRAPDFDINRTMYQVEHISGRGGTEYTAPSCAAMRTTGVCIRKDSLCERINHPLSYYKIKKKRINRSVGPGSGDVPVDCHPGPAHENDKEGDGNNIRDSGGKYDREADKEKNKQDEA
ncbi:MAG TPA: DNA primase regulatory subunit PriL [Methanoregulaceae archaeon]|nr:DNA primase regulatory subunit PriL [Methanoregulaceae archaeon]